MDYIAMGIAITNIYRFPIGSSMPEDVLHKKSNARLAKLPMKTYKPRPRSVVLIAARLVLMRASYLFAGGFYCLTPPFHQSRLSSGVESSTREGDDARALHFNKWPFL
jgi:hypothetical protein